MAIVRVFPGGSSGGFAGPGRAPDDDGRTRGDCVGWSEGASRRLIQWLWSVNPDGLSDDGWAVTLTMGGRPETSDDWHRVRKALMKRLERAGVTRQQWVTEWTAAGRPHLHMAVYGPGRVNVDILVSWLQLCDLEGWDATAAAQHIVPITGVTGWLEYVSKHAARGVAHYQRMGAPDGWTKTGRLWGAWGDWPIEVPVELSLGTRGFYRYRRLVTEWQRQRMRRAGAPASSWRRVGWRMGDKNKGRYMGVSGWIPDAVSINLALLASEADSTARPN